MKSQAAFNRHYKVDTNIKKILKEEYGFNDQQAEGISLAVDMREQDMSSYSTKSDIKDVLSAIKDLEIKMYKLYFGSTAIILGALGKMLGKW